MHHKIIAYNEHLIAIYLLSIHELASSRMANAKHNFTNYLGQSLIAHVHFMRITDESFVVQH